MNARESLERWTSGSLDFASVIRNFASGVTRWWVLYQVSEAGEKPVLTKGKQRGSRYVAVFTDREAVDRVQVEHPEWLKLVEEPALPFLIRVFRSEVDGMTFNPGLPSMAMIGRQELHAMIREYSVERLASMPGAWVPTQDENLLLVEMQPEQYTVTVYVSEADAAHIARRSGGQAKHHPWSVIFRRCRELGAEAPYLHFGLPEQMPLSPQDAQRILGAAHAALPQPPKEPPMPSMTAPQPDRAKAETNPSPNESASTARPAPASGSPRPERPSKPAERPAPSSAGRPIDPDVEAGLRKLEKATLEGQGMGNGWEVSRALAELRRIWVVVDQEGNMVILAGQDQSPIVDFFTSEAHAWRLIEEARRKNPALPPMTPRLISTRKLYRALAPRKPIVWINRGSEEAWTSITGHTLPYVMELKEQMEQGAARNT
ncbi:hypothetical protein [Staphylospora marina]|uniref:hypothetical protein n=1 Tax=Staphylospora marina TaxID=2490858 RepID=UPI000F5B922D|nr:hypothetical protein [Staphylospora marina]